MTKNNELYWIRIGANTFDKLNLEYEKLFNKIQSTDCFEDLIEFHSNKEFGYSYSEAAATFTELKEKILANKPKQRDNKKNIAFLFTGQGSQVSYMGYELYKTQPIFKKYFDECSDILLPSLKSDLRDIIFNSDSEKLNNTGYTQPALFVYEYSLAKLWQHIGVEPNWVIGHSVGEYPAASFARYLSLKDGLQLINKRAALMQSLPEGGTMAAVMARSEDIARFTNKHVEIAALNAPLQTVISGEKSHIQDTLKKLKENKIKGRELIVSHAFHSYLMDPILDEFAEFASRVTPEVPTAKLISNVSGKQLNPNDICGDYWKKHIRGKVNFLAGIQFLQNEGANCLVEIGPQPFLTGMAAKTCSHDLGLLASRKNRVSELLQIIQTAIELEEYGHTIKWENLFIPELRPISI